MSESRGKDAKKRRFASKVLAGVLVVGVLGIAPVVQAETKSTASAPPRVAVSWMRSWAITGQIMEALSRTNIPALYGASATFPNFLWGPIMNEAAMGAQVDGTNTGIVPTASLLSAGDEDDWVVVGRLVYFKVETVARHGTGIEKIKDLAGKKVAAPFGGGSHPYVVQRVEEAGLKLGTGPDKVQLVNLPPPEQPLAMESGLVDAVATWEPQTTITVGRGFGKIIDSFKHVGFITVRKDLARQHPDEIVNLLKAYIAANWYVATHRDQTDRWFAQTSGYELDLVKKIAEKTIEPNLGAQSIEDIDISLSEEDVESMNEVADYMYRANIIRRKFNLADYVDQSYLKRALRELKEQGYKTDKVKVR